MPRNGAPPNGALAIGRLFPTLDEALLIFGIVILVLGCFVTYFFVVEFDTTVPVDPEMEQWGHRSPRVHNIGLMHKQTVCTIAGIAVAVVGVAIALVGLIMWNTKRRVSQDQDAGPYRSRSRRQE
jgi:hypothetical protein